MIEDEIAAALLEFEARGRWRRQWRDRYATFNQVWRHRKRAEKARNAERLESYRVKRRVLGL